MLRFIILLGRLLRFLPTVPRPAPLAFALALLSAVISPSAYAVTILRVAAGSPAASPDGSSWAAAYPDLQTALAAANPTEADPVEIWIKTGVYKPTSGTDRNASFTLKNFLTLRGGFAGTESDTTQRVAASSATVFTVLSGDIGTAQLDTITASTPVNTLASTAFKPFGTGANDNSYNVLRASGVTSVALERLVIAGGRADGGALTALEVESMIQPTVNDGFGFRVDLDGRANGAGLYSSASGVNVGDCWFAGNYSRGIGGAVVARGGYLNVQSSKFACNISGLAGGAIALQAAAVTNFSGNTFYSNTASQYGGAVYIQGDSDNRNVKAYVANLLTTIASMAYGDPNASSSDGAGNQDAINAANFQRTGLALGQAVATLAASKIADRVISGVILALKQGASGFTTPYGAISGLVALVDFGVQVAIYFGVSPTSAFVEGYTIFSKGFAAWATPLGLAQSIVSAIFGNSGPSYEKRATDLRLKEYADNQSKSQVILLSQNRFEKNYSGGMGGAVALVHANAIIDRSMFLENNATFGGGGAFMVGYNDVNIENSAFVRNRTKVGHSAILTAFRSLNRFVNNTIVGNHSSSPNGYAVGVDTGSDVVVANCVLWDNTNGDTSETANPNRLGGADVFATIHTDLDASGLKVWNDAGDNHAMWTGVCDIRFSNIQSLDRLKTGGPQFKERIAGHSNPPNGYFDTELFSAAEANGSHLKKGWPNVGQGIRNDVRDSNKGNISRAPGFLQDYFPVPSSPVVGSGNSNFISQTASDLVGQIRIRDRIDMGAVESDYTFPGGTIFYVNEAVTSSGNGLTWATAFKTLREGLDAPLSPGGQIRVARGYYYVTSGTDRTSVPTLRPGVSLIGGFPPTGNPGMADRNLTLYPVTLTGNLGNGALTSDNSNTLLLANTTGSTLARVIDGIIFSDAAGGTAAVRLAAPAIIKNCVFQNNASGRALVLTDPANLAASGRIEIFDTRFENSLGGAIDCSVHNLSLIRTDFYENTGATTGGGLYHHLDSASNTAGSLNLERCIFFGNSASAGRGGAIAYLGKTLSVVHCTIADNSATLASGDTSSRGGAGVWWTTASSTPGQLTLINTILYGNRLLGTFPATTLELQQFGLPDVLASTTFTKTIKGNNIEGLTVLAVRGGSDNNFDYDPFFVNKAAHDFSLSAGSQMLNRVVPYTSGTDTVTAFGSGAEIGAREHPTIAGEYTPLSLTFATLPATDAGLNFTLTNTNFTSQAISFTWQVRSPGSDRFVAVVNDAYTSGVGSTQLTFTNPPRSLNGSSYRLLLIAPGVTYYSSEFILNVSPGLLYVKTSSSGTRDGSSWANATTLTEALSAASSGTQLWIAKGAYALVPTQLPAGVRFFAGFAGTETAVSQRAIAPAETVVTITGAAPGLNVRGSTTVIPAFDNFTLKAEIGDNPAIVLSGSPLNVNNMRFVGISQSAIKMTGGNLAVTGSLFTDTGATAIRLHTGTATIAQTQFIACGAPATQTDAGALSALDSTVTITDSRFERNYGIFGGAIALVKGVNVALGGLDIQRTSFLENEASSKGGAIFHSSFQITRAANSLFLRNRAPEGASAYVTGGDIYRPTITGYGDFVQCTFVDNQTGFQPALQGTGKLTNCLVYEPYRPNEAVNRAYALQDTYIYGSRGYFQDALPFYTSLPLFVDAAHDDYRLQASSPLRDIGGTNDSGLGHADLLGNARRYAGGQADIGCYEFAGPASTPLYLGTVPSNTAIYEFAGVNFTLITDRSYPPYNNGSLSWEYFNGTAWRPVSEQTGWNTYTSYVYPAGVYLFLGRASTTAGMDGQRMRVVSDLPGNPSVEFTLSFIPRDVFRVDRRVATSGNGLSWTTPFKTISEALAVAHSYADVWVVGGDYPETSLTLPAGARLYTGFVGTETSLAQRNYAANPVRLQSGASFFDLNPADPNTLPSIAFHINTAPVSRSVYVDKPVNFTVAKGAGTTAALAWQYRSGTSWLPISNLSGWTVTSDAATSTLSHSAVPQTQDNLDLRAVLTGTPETSFVALLDVKPRVIRYVDYRIGSPGNGLTWGTAFKTISSALAVADEGTDLWIVGGTYPESDIKQVEGVRFYAGFTGNETLVTQRNAVANLVSIVGLGGQVDLDSSTASPGRFQIATSPRSRTGYVGQPASFTATRAAGSTATLTWQYLSGASWLPASGLSGWTITVRGATTTISHASLTTGQNNLQLRVAVPGTTEHSFIARLAVTTRNVLRVNHAVTVSGNGSSWFSAFRTVEAALANADAGTDLWIAEGTYNEPLLNVPAGTNIFGGFAGNEATLSARNPATHPVILQDQGIGLLQVAAGAEYEITTVDGLRIAGNAATGGPGVNLTASSPVFNTVTFSGHPLAVFATGANASPVFTFCRFENNTLALQADPGVAVSLANSVLIGNTRGLVLASGSGSSVADTQFSSNQYAVESTPGLVLDHASFLANARSVTFSSGTATSLISGCTFAGDTVHGLASAAPVQVESSTFTSEVLGLSITNSSASHASTVIGSTFQTSGDGIQSFPGLIVRDSAFTGLARGLAISGSYPATAAFTGLTQLTGSTFGGLTVQAVSVTHGELRADRCSFAASTAPGPLVALGSTTIGQFTNSRFTDNVLASGPVISSGGLYLVLNHVTVAHNNTGTWPGAIDKLRGSIYLRNSIVWRNRSSGSTPANQLSGVSSDFQVRDSIVENLYANPDPSVIPYDPLFVAPASGNFALQAASPAIDLSQPFVATTLDLAGANRIQSTAADLGAYESAFTRAASPVLLTYFIESRSLTTGDTHTWTAATPAGSGQSLRWQVDRNDGNGYVNLIADANHVITSSGDSLALAVLSQLSYNGYRYRITLSSGVTDLYSTAPAIYTVTARPIFYVNAAATGANNGTSWTNAYTTLAAALAVAPSFSDIRVAAGTHIVSNPAFRRAQHLTGGWNTTTNTRDPVNTPTLLTSAAGANAGTVILSANADLGAVDALATIDGFTFTSGGRAFSLANASPVVSNCRFVNMLGYAVAATGGAPRFESCVFTGGLARAFYGSAGCGPTFVGCTFSGNAGAIQFETFNGSALTTVTDSTFTGNTDKHGGAIYTRSPLTILRSVFTGNSATGDQISSGGAIRADNGLTVRDSLFAQNTSTFYAGAIRAFGPVFLTHVTIADNQSGSYGSALEVSGVTLRNSIIWGNSALNSIGGLQFQQFAATSTTVLENNIIQGLISFSGPGLLFFPPRFVDPAGNDYRLAADSPAIDAGLASAVLPGETDLLGAARTQLTAPDLGAFEASSATSPVSEFGLPATLAGPPQSSFLLTQPVPPGYSGTWQYLDGATWRDFVGQFPATGPTNTVSGNFLNYFEYASNTAKLQINQIVTGADGRQLRFRLISGSSTWFSAPVTFAVTPLEIIYVDSSRPSSGDGATWATAYRTFGEALANVNLSRRIIHLAEGLQRGPFTITKRLEIYGGFPGGGGTLAQRDPAAHPTVLTGLPLVGGDPRAATVVTFATSQDTTETILDGVTVSDGQTGLRASEVSPILRNLTVTGHTDTGLFLNKSTARVESSRFENNTGFNGGALCITDGAPVLDRLTLRGNTATSTGGAIYAYSSFTLTNSLLSGNVADLGGAFFCANNYPQLAQLTLAGNRARASAAIHVAGGQVVLRNSIVWGNTATETSADPQLAPASKFNLARVTVEQTSLTSGVFPQNPWFVSPVAAASAPTTTGDYRLATVSPARDVGDNTLVASLPLDLAAQPRIAGSTVDLGAYEATDAAATPFAIGTQPASLVFRRDLVGNTFTFAATGVTGIEWQIAAPAGGWTSLVGNPAFSGATSATLTVLAADPALNGYRFRAVLAGAGARSLTTVERTITIYTPRYFVNAAGPAGDGLAWGTAFSSLDTALAAIPYDPEGTELWLATGAYTPATAFRLNAGLSLYGGFNGTESTLAQRDPAANVTALVGASGQPVVVSLLATNPAGPGVRLDSLTVRDSTGLGLDNPSGRALTLDRVRFTGLNRAMDSRHAVLAIRRSEFRGNGSAIVDSAPLTVVGGTVLIENSLFAGNRSNYYSAAYISAVAVLRHVTFAANQGRLEALTLNDKNNQTYNCVFWGNRNGNGVATLYGYGLYVGRNNVIEGYQTYLHRFSVAFDNTGLDPRFVSPAAASSAPTTAGDYRLGDTSFAIDTGINTESTATPDLAGNSRQFGLFVDPGAYENQTAGLYTITTQPVATTASAQAPAVFTVATYRPATFAWESSTDSGTNYTPIGGATSATLSIAGSPAVDGRLYRARVQFATGPEVVSNAAQLTYLNVAALAGASAGFATPATFTSSATAAVSSYLWQVKIGNAAFVDLPAETSATLSVLGDASFSNRTYRIKATFAAGPVLVSNAVAFTYADAVPGLVVATPGALTFSLTGGISPASLTDSSLAVHAAQTGRLTFADSALLAPAFDGDSASLSLAGSLHAGERAQVTLTSALRRADGIGARPRVFEFRQPTLGGIGVFDTPAALAPSASAFALGDLDGDGSLDALVATPSGLQAYANDGFGVFTASGSAFGPTTARALALGSLTSGSALDAVALTSSGDVEVYLNNGAAVFTSGQVLPASATALALGDLDADGDLDLLVTTTTGNQVYLNNGAGVFALATTFGSPSAAAAAVALADFDLDGDLDVLAAGTTLWLNNGSGTSFFLVASYGAADRIALGDFNADGQTDFALSRAGQPARLYRHTTGANFQLLSAAPGGGLATLAAGDLDGDGRADLLLTDATGSTGAWLTSASLASNRAEGQLGLALGSAAELADLNDDGALDLFALSATGEPVASLYRLTATRTDEDTDATLAAAGFTPSASTVHVRTLPAHGTLLTAAFAPVSVADSFTAAEAATLVYRPDTNFFGLDSFTWSPASSGTTYPHWLLVYSVTDNITTTADSIALSQGGTSTTLTGGATSVLANDINTEAGAFVATVVQTPAHGTLNLSSNGTFTYTHNDTETRTDSFTYRATNLSTGRSADAVVSIAVANVNAAPFTPAFAFASAPLYTGQAAGLTAGTLSATDPDPEDAGLLTYSFGTGGGDTDNAQFVLEGATLKTAATLDFAAGLSRSVRLRATDPAGLSTDCVVSVTLIRAPEALAASLSPTEDTTYGLTLTGAGGATALTYEVLTVPAHGTLTGTAPSLTYSPDPDFNGPDSFTFRVADANLTSAGATVSLTVSPTNDAPTLEGQNLATDEDTPITFTLVSDDIDGDTLAYAVATNPSRGHLSITGNQVTYTPNTNANGSDFFRLYAYDGHNGVSPDTVFTVAIAPVADAPVLVLNGPTSIGLLRDQTYTATTTLSDGDGDPVSFVTITAPAHGTLVFDGSSITYVPLAGYAGPDSYTVAASDGVLQSAPVTVDFVIFDPAPYAPVAAATINLDQRGNATWYLQGVDPQGEAVVFDILTLPAHGNTFLHVNTTSNLNVYQRAVTYTPNADFFGSDTLTYVVRDANGNVSDPATITFEVAHINLLPAAAPLSLSNSGLVPNAPLTLSGTDPEGAPLTYRLLTLPTQGNLDFADGSGPVPIGESFAANSIIYTPPTRPFLDSVAFDYVVNDGEDDSAAATVSLTFVRNLRTPLSFYDNGVVYRGFETYLPVLINDFDTWGDPLRITAVTDGAHGTVSRASDEYGVANQRVLYTHTNNSAATTDTFTYTVSNSEFSVTETVNVTIVDHVINVTSAADHGPGTLRDALDTVSRFGNRWPTNGSGPVTWRILLEPLGFDETYAIDSVGDTLRGDSYFALDFGQVSIESNYPVTLAPRFYAAPARFFRVGYNAVLALNGPITLSGGVAHEGGAIFNEGRVVLDGGVILSGNTALPSDDGTEPGLGGAIYQHNGILKLFDVHLTGNVADNGGGLYQLGDGALPYPPSKSLDPIYLSRSAVIADGAVFSGHGSAKDFRSATVNGGTADLLATDLTADAPTAPWMDVVPDDVVKTQYRHTIPVLLELGQTLSLTQFPNYGTAIIGTGDTRTIIATATPFVGYPPIAEAAGGGVTFRRQFNFSYDPGASHPPIARDDSFAIGQRYTPVVLDAFANDEDPDNYGLAPANSGLGIHTYTQPTRGYDTGFVNTNYLGQLTFTAYGELDGSEDTFTYTLANGGTATVHIKLTPTTVDVTDAATLRDTLALANINSAQTWTIRPTTAALLEAETLGESNSVFGDSAFVIKGSVVFDGSALEDATLRRADAAPAMRLFHVLPGATLTLRHFAVENGSATLGGAIYNEGTVLLDEATLQNNHGHLGGAIYSTQATVTVTGSLLAGNDAHLGGAIYSTDATLTITGSIVQDNAATDLSETELGFGGAIYQRNGTVLIDGSYFVDNSAHNGGALYAEGTSGADATATINDSLLVNTSAIADIAGTGSVGFHRTNSSISRIDGPSIGSMNDLNLAIYTIDGTAYAESIIYYTNEDAPGLSLSAHSSLQGIIADSDIIQEYADGIRRLNVTPVASGITEFTLTASSGPVSFSEHFRVFANTGLATNPTVYPQVAEVYPYRSVVIDVINSVAPPSDPYGLPLTVVSVTTPSHGTAVITADNKILYTHTDTEITATDEFFYTLSNGFGGSASSGVQIQFKPTEIVLTSFTQFEQMFSYGGYLENYPDLPWKLKVSPSLAGQSMTISNNYRGTPFYYTAAIVPGKVTIDGTDAPGFTLHCSGGSSGPPLCHFYIQPGAELHLKNIRLTGGNPSSFDGPSRGGAIANQGLFTAEGVTFENNRGISGDALGGAIYNDEGTVSLTGCAFIGNSVNGNGFGGAIASRNGSLALADCTFSGNSATTAPNVYVFGDGAAATVTSTGTTVLAFKTGSLNGGSVTAVGLPAAVDDTVIRIPGQPLKIALASLLANDANAAGAALTFAPTSAQGVSITKQGNFLFYLAPVGMTVNDTFTYTLTNAGGSTSIGAVSVNVQSTVAPTPVTTLSLGPRAGGGTVLNLVGVPGRTYTIEVSDDLSSWSVLGSATADSHGLYTIEDPVEPAGGSRFYRAVYTVN